MGFLSEMRLILQIGAHFRRREPAAQRKGLAAVVGLLAMRGWTALCPKVKLEGEKDTTGCRLIWAVADLVKHSVWDETTSCAALMEGGGSAANTLESRVGLKRIS